MSTPDLGGGGFDLPGGDDPISAVLSVLVLIVLVPVLLFLVVVVGELLLALLLLPLVVLLRVAFGMPWTIEVLDGKGTLRHHEPVRGWTASGMRIRQLAAELSAGGGRYRFPA